MGRLLILIFILSVACMAQEYDSLYAKQVEEAWEKLEKFIADDEPSLEVRLCVDKAYGLVIVIDKGFFEKWRETKAKYYIDIRIELPDTAIDLTYKEFVKRIKGTKKN